MKKTLLFLDQQSWRGGAQHVLEATLDSLADEYDCVVAFPDHGPFRSTLAQNNIETTDLPIGTYQPGRKSFFETISFAWRTLYCAFRLVFFIRRRRVALLYINGPRCLPAGALAAWWTGRPAIFHLHLILNRRLEANLAAICSRRISRILTCSRAAAASLLDRAPDLSVKTQVLYNPLPRAEDEGETAICRAAKRGNDDRFTIGMVGRITETKGQHLLLRALSTLPSGLREKIQLIIVGAPAPGCDSDLRYETALRRDAKGLGLDGQITWSGYQANPGPLYASMDVLVHPALAEAMCIVILEALNNGIPVIASDTGGIPEVVQHGVNGLLVSLDDSKALSDTLKFFIETPEVRERLRSGARRSVEARFSVEVFSTSMRSVIGELCPSETDDVAGFNTGLQRS